LDDNELKEVMIDEGEPQLSWSDDADQGFEEDSKNSDEDLDDDLSFDLDDLDDLDELDAETDDRDWELTRDADEDEDEELILDDEMELVDLDLEGGGLEMDLVDDDTLGLNLAGDSLKLGDDDDELNLDQDAASKLDLARAYIEMGDNDGAKPLLQEGLVEGDDVQVSEANELLGNIPGKA